jgi:hypothetical protein
MADRIPKAEVLFQAAAQYLGAHGNEDDPRAIRAWWVIHYAAWRLAARCAVEDGDLAAVEREGERLYQMLAGAAGTEDILAEEQTRQREKLS